MKVLVLASTGFGKSTSIGRIPELGIQGLNPKETYLVSCVQKELPFPGYETLYKETTFAEISKGNRIITKSASEIAQIIAKIAGSAASPYKTIVLDDLNYISQDHFMKNALKGGWDTPKQIGYNMGLIFDEIEKVPKNKNVIVLAHYEEYKDKSGDSMSYRYKSTGNMVAH